MKKILDSVGGYTALISAIFGGFSALKFVHDIIYFDFSYPFNKLNDFYVTYFLQVVEFSFDFINIKISETFANLILLYLIIGTAFFRAMKAAGMHDHIAEHPKKYRYLINTVEFLYTPIMFTTVTIMFPIYRMVLYFRGYAPPEKRKEMNLRARKTILVYSIGWFYIMLGFSVFFVLNYAFL